MKSSFKRFLGIQGVTFIIIAGVLIAGHATAAQRSETAVSELTEGQRMPGRCVVTTELVTDPVTGAQKIVQYKRCEYTESEARKVGYKVSQ